MKWPPENEKKAQVNNGPGQGPPSHAPAHGYRRKYGYRYYPDAQVYFDTARKAYFYLDGGTWQMSVSIPSELKINLGDYVEIEMENDKPYTEFKAHQAKYPKGKFKNKKKGNKW
ncbi:MAG TPA: hypothetical protein HPP69_07155 [Deltaproteobacteria bacterium]|nr:hypothetical protein [Deltaproteobacteria bacterium]